MEDLGYCNGWKTSQLIHNKWFPLDNTPDIVKKCRKLGHKTYDTNLDLTQHGYNTLTTCEECGYCYHTDSSD